MPGAPEPSPRDTSYGRLWIFRPIDELEEGHGDPQGGGVDSIPKGFLCRRDARRAEDDERAGRTDVHELTRRAPICQRQRKIAGDGAAVEEAVALEGTCGLVYASRVGSFPVHGGSAGR